MNYCRTYPQPAINQNTESRSLFRLTTNWALRQSAFGVLNHPRPDARHLAKFGVVRVTVSPPLMPRRDHKPSSSQQNSLVSSRRQSLRSSLMHSPGTGLRRAQSSFMQSENRLHNRLVHRWAIYEGTIEVRLRFVAQYEVKCGDRSGLRVQKFSQLQGKILAPVCWWNSGLCAAILNMVNGHWDLTELLTFITPLQCGC